MSSLYERCMKLPLVKMWKPKLCCVSPSLSGYLDMALGYLWINCNTQLLLSKKTPFACLFIFYYENFQTLIKVERLVQGVPYTHSNADIQEVIFVLFA